MTLKSIPKAKRRQVRTSEILALVRARGPVSAREVAAEFDLSAVGNVTRRLEDGVDAGTLVRQVRERRPGQAGTVPVTYSVRD